MVEKKSTGLCKIHNVRFYNLTPRSINYLAYNARYGRLAVSRLAIKHIQNKPKRTLF